MGVDFLTVSLDTVRLFLSSCSLFVVLLRVEDVGHLIVNLVFVLGDRHLMIVMNTTGFSLSNAYCFLLILTVTASR